VLACTGGAAFAAKAAIATIPTVFFGRAHEVIE
jgi:hypothetical protein